MRAPRLVGRLISRLRRGFATVSRQLRRYSGFRSGCVFLVALHPGPESPCYLSESLAFAAAEACRTDPGRLAAAQGHDLLVVRCIARCIARGFERHDRRGELRGGRSRGLRFDFRRLRGQGTGPCTAGRLITWNNRRIGSGSRDRHQCVQPAKAKPTKALHTPLAIHDRHAGHRHDEALPAAANRPDEVYARKRRARRKRK